MQSNIDSGKLAKVIASLKEGDEISVYLTDNKTLITCVVFDVIRGETVVTNTGRVICADSSVIVTPTGRKHASYPVCEKAIKKQTRLKYYLLDTPSPASEPE